MDTTELITVKRNCEVTMIPYGVKSTLKEGDQVRLTQALGGSYTVIFNGNMFRVDNKDADAIGQESVDHGSEKDSEIPFSENMVWDVMKTCYDPEIPVNIVDLGLIYSCDVAEIKEGGVNVTVKMTLTAPGCGMGGVIAEEVKSKIEGIPQVADANVELVWEPQWNQEMMSESAKLHLGML